MSTLGERKRADFGISIFTTFLLWQKSDLPSAINLIIQYILSVGIKSCQPHIVYRIFWAHGNLNTHSANWGMDGMEMVYT